MRRIPVLFITVLFLTVAPCQGFAEVELYSGTILIIKSSGKACAGFKNEHAVELVIKRDKGGREIDGYFEGDDLVTGHFSGNNASRLDVRYPDIDELKSSGHFISIAADGDSLRAELHERHIEDIAGECNFDLAQLTLRRVNSGQSAEARFKRAASLFDARLMRSGAIAMTEKGGNAEAISLYEKSLALVDSVAGKDPDLITPYLTGLGAAYFRAGRFKDFNRLYDERISGIKDEISRSFFTVHHARALMNEGRTDMMRENYDSALAKFQQAYRLYPRSKEIVLMIAATYARSGKYDDAVTLLEDELKSLKEDNNRNDLNEALALVYYEKAKKDGKAGKDSEAETLLKKAGQLAPDNFHYLVALARLRHKSGSLEEAEDILNDGLKRFKDEAVRNEIIAARDRMRQTEMILKKIRKVES